MAKCLNSLHHIACLFNIKHVNFVASTSCLFLFCYNSIVLVSTPAASLFSQSETRFVSYVFL